MTHTIPFDKYLSTINFDIDALAITKPKGKEKTKVSVNRANDDLKPFNKSSVIFQKFSIIPYFYLNDDSFNATPYFSASFVSVPSLYLSFKKVSNFAFKSLSFLKPTPNNS